MSKYDKQNLTEYKFMTIVAADIGGTNARFGLFHSTNGGLWLDHYFDLPTAQLHNTESLLHTIEQGFNLSIQNVDATTIAIAAPTHDNKGKFPNADLEIDFTALALYPPRFTIINDFTAQAYALEESENPRYRKIFGISSTTAKGRRALIGAGTGLGYASTVYCQAAKQWIAVPAEKGHSPFPFYSERELNFHKFLCKRFNIKYAPGDYVLTGRGLSALHFFLTGESLSPRDVSAQALNSNTETLEWYARFYGRACKDWALSTLCDGGLWISGGIAIQNPICIDNEFFRKEFITADEIYSQFLKELPIYLITKTDNGLWGAANYAFYNC